MILFVSACDNGQAEQSEADKEKEVAETEVESVDELTELEKENEALRKEIAEKENRELKAELEAEEEDSLVSEDVDSEEDSSVEEETKEITVQEFTMEEQQEMNDMFYNWAVERAKIGGMAVTAIYFNHGAAGRGDWYAITPDGEVQTQNQDNPGFDHFGIHSLGGVAFYTPASGDFGADENAPFPSTAEGYSKIAVPSTNIHKYMLGDNGVVYELIGKKEQMSYTTGFGEYADDGTRGEFIPSVAFEISGDQDAQQEWQRILRMYR